MLIALVHPPPSRLAAYAPCALASVLSEIAPVRVRFRYVERGGFPACLPTGEARLLGNFLVFFTQSKGDEEPPSAPSPESPRAPETRDLSQIRARVTSRCTFKKPVELLTDLKLNWFGNIRTWTSVRTSGSAGLLMGPIPSSSNRALMMDG